MNRNKRRQYAFIKQKYLEWKKRNEDIPDTYFLYKVLPTMGHFIAYKTLMNIKHHHGKKENLDK
jgi:hypothetical protein